MCEQLELRTRILALCREIDATYQDLVQTVRAVALALSQGVTIDFPAGADDSQFRWAIETNRLEFAARVSPAGVEARARYHAARNALYPSMEEALKRLRAGDTSMLDWAIFYLEADPWDYHSGYFKQTLMRALRRVPLAEIDRERLRSAILSTLPKGRRQEQNEVRALARRLDTPAFREALATIAKDHQDEATRERAEMTLAACKLNDVHHDLRGAVNRSASST